MHGQWTCARQTTGEGLVGHTYIDTPSTGFGGLRRAVHAVAGFKTRVQYLYVYITTSII